MEVTRTNEISRQESYTSKPEKAGGLYAYSSVANISNNALQSINAEVMKDIDGGMIQQGHFNYDLTNPNGNQQVQTFNGAKASDIVLFADKFITAVKAKIEGGTQA